jgi:hypothetical protein
VKGAPIRFVAAVLGGWVCVRIAVLLPDVDRLELAGGVLAPPAAAAGRPSAATPIFANVSVPAAAAIRSAALAAPEPPRPRSYSAAPAALPAWRAAQNQPPRRVAGGVPSIIIPPTIGTAPADAPESRWAASAWLLTRGGANGTLTGGQLGASQAGLRMTYLLDERRRVALAARIATPLRGRGTEAAIGLDWQPTAAPVHLVLEQRVGLDGARGGPTALAIAGLNPTPIAAGFRLEAYAQGGVILRDGKAEGFGDGAARLARPVATLGGATLDLGLGAWAAGQRGAARVDAGPTLGVALPVAGRSVRVSLDWRQRVAGDARPGSGVALSVGSDF